jgi:hypothetical protein
MSKITPSTEPVALATALQAAIIAVVAFLTEFGVWSPTDGQVGAMLGLYAAFVIVLGAWQRNRVSPIGGTK